MSQNDEDNAKLAALNEQTQILRQKLYMLSHAREAIRRKQRRQLLKSTGIDQAEKWAQNRKDYNRKYYLTVQKTRRSERRKASLKEKQDNKEVEAGPVIRRSARNMKRVKPF